MIETGIDFKDVYRRIIATDPDSFEALDVQSSSGWFVAEDGEYQCFFSDGAYHCLLDSPNSFRVSVLSQRNFTNVAVQVEMTLLAGNGGGLVFGAHEHGYSGYRMFYGRPHIDLVSDVRSLFYTEKNTPALETSAQLTIVAYEDNLLVYVNGELLTHRRADYDPIGALGFLVVHFAGYEPTHVAFRNLRIWEHLPSFSAGEQNASKATSDPVLNTRPDWGAMTQEQIALTRLLVEELSSTLHYERDEKGRLYAELVSARQRIDELTRSNYELRLQLEAALRTPLPASEVQQALLLSQPGPVLSLRSIEPFREADRWFDEGKFDDTEVVRERNLSISGFLLRSGNIVDGIQALYGENALPLAPAHGNLESSDTAVMLEPGDGWSEISGFYGEWFAGSYVLQLTFHTRKGKTYGPFGNMKYASEIEPFSLEIQPDERILALSGVVSFGNNGKNRHLGALGLVLCKG